MNAFTDRITETALHWDDVWKEIIPITALGRKVKNELLPYTSESLQKWDREMDVMALMLEVERLSECKRHLEKIKDVEDMLDLLRSGYPGTVTDWFMLKQFLFHCHAFFLSMKDWARGQGIIDSIFSLLSELNKGETMEAAFSIHDLQDRELSELYRTKSELEMELREQQNEWERELQKQLSHHWKSTPFFISIHDAVTIEKLETHPFVRKVTETPFEIGYEILSSPEIETMRLSVEKQLEQIDERERQILSELRLSFLPYVPFLKGLHHTVGEWDWRIAKVEWIKNNGAVRPSFTDKGVSMIEGRHPYIEKIVMQKGREFTGVTMDISEGVTLIAGPNMGGKSVALKTVGLAVMLFHYGLWIPAQSFQACFFPNVIVVKGDEEQVESGLSTFGAEMLRIASVLKNKESLFLFDEVARGTNPEEGSRLARALVEYLQENKYTCLMVSHFTSAMNVNGVKRYRLRGLTEEGISLLTIDFEKALKEGIDYTLEEVEKGSIPRQAIVIAKALGLPESIIERAKREENNG